VADLLLAFSFVVLVSGPTIVELGDQVHQHKLDILEKPERDEAVHPLPRTEEECLKKLTCTAATANS
jgi:hypothetical protein